MADRADYPAESTAMSTVAAVPPAFDALIQALREPSCYPHPVETVRVVETHISCVLLAGEFAYKLKKPVDLGFLEMFFCSIEMEGDNPSIESTSGFRICSRNWRA